MNEYQGPGFYYHYKHDDAKGIFDCAYEVIGIGHNTEAEDWEGEGKLIVYRPLYDSSAVYTLGKHFWVRPYAMFLDMVTKEGKTFSRFTKITDSDLIIKLEEKRKEMYK